MRALLPLLLLFSSAAFAGEWTGLVTCDKCKHTDESAQSCARSCVRGGVAAGFVNGADKKYYKVANQDKVKDHVGQKVVITGTESGGSITVTELKVAQ